MISRFHHEAQQSALALAALNFTVLAPPAAATYLSNKSKFHVLVSRHPALALPMSRLLQSQGANLRLGILLDAVHNRVVQGPAGSFDSPAGPLSE